MPEYRILPGGFHDKVIRCRKKLQVAGGGFGNGKTAVVCIKAIMLCKDYPGCNGLIAMATYAQLNDTIREEFFKWVPPSSVKRWPTIADNTLIFKNGSKINFRYLQQKGKAMSQDGQTSSNLLSATYDFAIVDQIENPAITYKDFLDLFGRLRGSTKYHGTDDTMPRSGPRWLILTANPSFNWVFHKIIKPWEHYKKTGEHHPDLIVDPETDELMVEVFEASTYENAHNLEPDFIKGLEATYTGQFRDRYLGGEWGAFEGLVYPQFDPAVHMISKETMMQYLFQLNYRQLKPRFIEGFDFGIASPSCYLCGFIDHRGRVFIIDGFYKAGMTLQAIAQRIGFLRDMYESYVNIDRAVLADPAIFRRQVLNNTGAGADTIARIMIEQYDIAMKAGQNDILNGITKVGTYLSVKTFPHFLTNELNGAMIYFVNTLTFLADEFQGYFWKTGIGMERLDVPIDRNDHGMDTLKYMFSYLPDAAELMFNMHDNYGVPQWMRMTQN